jgi:transposase-like protein
MKVNSHCGYSKAFREEAVKMVVESGNSAGQVARELCFPRES